MIKDHKIYMNQNSEFPRMVLENENLEGLVFKGKKH